MERGQMRVEANISVSRDGKLGTKVEVKNLNSFRAMERAVEYEIRRQTTLLENGGTVAQETRGWNEVKQETFVQRIKEGSADYRYFPDPDLPSLKLSELESFNESFLKKTLPELPAERITRYLAQGLKVEDAKQFTVNPVIGKFFDDVSSKIGKDSEEKIRLATNYIANDLVNSLRRDIDDQDTEIKAEISISPSNFASLMILLSEGKLSSRGGKDVLAQMILSGSDPESIAKERGLFQNSSEESLLPAIRTVIESNEKVVADYRSGKEVALMFLVGQAMKATKGSGNPEIIKKMLISELRK
jgi:aspartyl-tRNA(Asn)/glutamyl-tRNA(Gln) amidotransferase subunit B